ncbi:MAG TPA: neutral/alkaline non-lysosomal ceramidase N-terminal domain-containing protein [Candidatus Methylomirabilis sp.]|nr:neutral/alkaline non-lysosomal ceramidase N-terminal domain-containing protein [Candidatus Methylomirabilis sp.]
MRGLSARAFRRALAATLVVTWSGVTSPALASRNVGTLLAGAARVEVTLPSGTPLGGYGGFPRRAWLPDILGRHPYAFWFRPSTGVHDPITIRSLVLESGQVRLLWVTLDLVGIDPGLLTELRPRLAQRGLSYTAVVASASHTHSGPGAYADSALFGFLAVDRLSPSVRAALVAGLEDAARRADAGKIPARIAFGRTEVRDIAESRVREPLDQELGVVKVVGVNGRPVAAIWNYAIHGTALGRDNFLLSGDLMGDAGERIERAIGAPALFVNGAVGDVSPRPRGWTGVQTAGQALAAGALRAWDSASAEPNGLQVATERVPLPTPSVALRNCLDGWAPGWMNIGLADALPSATEVTAIGIGRTGWVTIPGELETRLGLEIKAWGKTRFGQVLIAGVSNDYLGYFLAPVHYRRPSYIACASLYGERGGEVVRSAATAALERLASAEGRRR